MKLTVMWQITIHKWNTYQYIFDKYNPNITIVNRVLNLMNDNVISHFHPVMKLRKKGNIRQIFFTKIDIAVKNETPEKLPDVFMEEESLLIASCFACDFDSFAVLCCSIDHFGFVIVGVLYVFKIDRVIMQRQLLYDYQQIPQERSCQIKRSYVIYSKWQKNKSDNAKHYTTWKCVSEMEKSVFSQLNKNYSN